MTGAWEQWNAAANSPARIIAHSRIFLIFLLIRYGGLRLGEVSILKIDRHLDTDTGVLLIPGAFKRRIILPAFSLKKFRKITQLKDAYEKDFLQMDPGFIRRMFYKIADECGIERERSGPRALRFARGSELLTQHMPLPSVKEYLGLKTSDQVLTFLKSATPPGNITSITCDTKIIPNRFLALVTGLAPEVSKIGLQLCTFNNQYISVLCQHENFIKLEPGLDKIIAVTIAPEQIFVFYEPPAGLFINTLMAEVKSISINNSESHLILDIGDNVSLVAIAPTQYIKDSAFKTGDQVFACFTAYAPKLNIP